MTGSTPGARVFRVVKRDVETAQWGKGFDLSALCICVTDSADLTCRIRELLRVTTSARCMCSFAGQRRLRRVVFTTMAQQTGQPRMLSVFMFELRKVSRIAEQRVRIKLTISRCDGRRSAVCLLVARIAVRRQRRQFAFLVMTGETGRMSQQTRFKSRILRVTSFVALGTLRIRVLVMGKSNVELGNKPGAACA